ncbi:hypothetical protein BDY17DRAFT_294052 [Neohortaea acidophila]|uniref:Uncharacterized protein n=1 Tax=Neohortaea acidophila TaxID=245834 RepID=A0A6A6Q0Z5_9PEZI|nr:uncharacterized protein BDY17DRAFT_294052 [Neohortaea acidophila]KAF2485664.1 hypothetical protein BDY17DRAFT_294052 [Neohortaea acidophila]
MLDENLPTFFLKPSITGTKHHNEYYLTHHGSEPEPAYHLERADPASPSPAHKNCYAAALFDAYNPEILFGEVLARPEWTKATQAESVGGVPPPPQPVLPSEFTVQLYNPDQQIKVEVKSSKWGGQDYYEFSMPQDVFRTPSASSLDKGRSDPASLEITPRINFEWRKDSRLNKDLTCFMTGKSTDTKKKNSRKDPDISIALWRGMKELTMYEPNLTRVEMEDPKGLEVVLLLTAAVIKDLYFSSKEQTRELFNISEAAIPAAMANGSGRKVSNPQVAVSSVAAAPVALGGKHAVLPRLQTTPTNAHPSNLPPFPDARAQWELDAETARLKAQAEQEKAAVLRRRREQEKRDEAERKRLQKMVEEEEKAARRKQAEIDKETERLRKLYGVQPIPQHASGPPQRPHPNGHGYSHPQYMGPPGPPVGSNGLYVQPSASTSNVMMSGGNGNVGNGAPGRTGFLKKKTSFWR